MYTESLTELNMNIHRTKHGIMIYYLFYMGTISGLKCVWHGGVPPCVMCDNEPITITCTLGKIVNGHTVQPIHNHASTYIIIGDIHDVVGVTSVTCVFFQFTYCNVQI